LPATRVPEPITVSFFARGWVPNRQPLYSALTFIGINPVQFHDMAWDGINCEYTDQLTVRRRPPFVKYCTQQLAVNEIVNQFYGTRDLNENITIYADTNQNLYTVTPSALTSKLVKGTPNQGHIAQVGNMTYYADGVDAIKIDNLGNVSAWGIAAPTVAPVLTTGVFWKSVIPYATNSILEDTNGNVELLTAGANTTSGVLEPQWPTPILSSTLDGNITWLNCGSIGNWIASTAFAKDAVILDTNGNIEIATTPGTSGTTIPVWSTGVGSTTTDSGVTWTNYGYGSPLAFSGYSWVYAYRTYYGELSTASQPSNFTGPILGPQRVSVTAFSISSGVVTFTGVNNYVAGAVFQVQGMTNAPYLNNSAFTVLSSGLSTSVFKANLTQAQINAAANAGQNTGTTISDSGYTLNAITTLIGEGALTSSGAQNPLCNSVATISNVGVNNNVVTCLVSGYSPASAIFSPGIWVTIAGLTGASFLNGSQVQVTSASNTQFTFNFTATNYGPSSDSGTATFNAIEIYRVDDGGGIYYFDGAVSNPSPSVYDSGAVIAGLGTGGSWTTPNNVTQTGASYATIGVTEGSGAVTFAKVQGASGSAQYVTGSQTNTGATAPSTFVSDSGGSQTAWTVSGSTWISSPDGTHLFTQNADFSNFGFAIPSTATINGVVASFFRESNISGIFVVDNTIELFTSTGGTFSSNKASSANWPVGSFGQATYGASNDLWGMSLTPSIVNASSFGLRIQAKRTGGVSSVTPTIETIRLTIYYTPANGAPTSCTATLGTITSGNAIIVCVQGVDGVPTISSNQSGTYTQLAASGTMAVFACYNPATTAPTITANSHSGGTGGLLLLVQEVFGIIGSAPQQDSGSPASSSASTATGSVTTTTANDAICTFLLADASPSFTVPASNTSLGSITTQENGSVYGIADAFQQVSSTGTYNPNWTLSGTALNGVTVAFKVAVLGSSGPLNATTFGLNVPFGVITGIQTAFHAKTSSTNAPCTVTAQLLRNGAPIGNKKTTPNLTTSDAPYTLGGSADTWGLPWNYFNFNNSGFGVQLTVTVGVGTAGTYTFSINDVTEEIFASVSTWTFVDAVPDSQLITSLIAPLSHLNDTPPGQTGSTVMTGGKMIVYWNGRIWMAVGNKVYFSAGPDTLNGIPESCFPPAYSFTFPGNVTGLRVITGGVVVAVADMFWSIQGGPQTTAFYPDKYLTHIGVLTPNCLEQDGDTLLAYTAGSQFFEIQAGQKQELGGNPVSPIGNVLLNGWGSTIVQASPWLPSNSSITVHRNGYDAGIWISNGTDSLLRYGINVNNFSPVYQPLLSGLPHAGVISSVETAPGVWSLLLASNVANDFIYVRNFAATTFQDNGNSYPMSIIIGNIIMSEPTQNLVPIEFISAYSALIGSVPTVSWLPNEINAPGLAVAPFTVLPLVQNEPAQLVQSQTIMARRWPISANQSAVPLPVRHLQVKVDYGSTDTVANELLTLCVTPKLPIEVK
jgi:hypothetical protein